MEVGDDNCIKDHRNRLATWLEWDSLSEGICWTQAGEPLTCDSSDADPGTIPSKKAQGLNHDNLKNLDSMILFATAKTGFPATGVPQVRFFTMENLVKMDDL